MIVLVVVAGILLSLAGLFYLILGRNRYGATVSRKQLTDGAGAAESAVLKPEPCRIVRVYFIKPSRYDDEGYVSISAGGCSPTTP